MEDYKREFLEAWPIVGRFKINNLEGNVEINPNIFGPIILRDSEYKLVNKLIEGNIHRTRNKNRYYVESMIGEKNNKIFGDGRTLQKAFNSFLKWIDVCYVDYAINPKKDSLTIGAKRFGEKLRETFQLVEI